MPQIPEDQDPASADEVVQEAATTNHMAAAEEVKAAAKVALPVMVVRMVEAEATTVVVVVVGTVARGVDRVGRMAKDNRTGEARANRVGAAMAMVSNNNTKVNKVVILDSLVHSRL